MDSLTSRFLFDKKNEIKHKGKETGLFTLKSDKINLRNEY